jgi:hypothetical protein
MGRPRRAAGAPKVRLAKFLRHHLQIMELMASGDAALPEQ